MPSRRQARKSGSCSAGSGMPLDKVKRRSLQPQNRKTNNMNTNQTNVSFQCLRLLCSRTKTWLLLAAFLLCLIGTARAQAPPDAPITAPDAIASAGGTTNTASFGESREGCRFFGRTLAAWNALYERWVFGVITVPTDFNGNAVVPPGVVLMPLPDAPGWHTRPSRRNSLQGTGLRPPALGPARTHYADGTPSDPLVPRSVFRRCT